MNFLRKHWCDLGGFFGIVWLVILLFFGSDLSDYRLLMWLSLISLFFHQFEEYRFPGTFPGMLNRVMFNNENVDRYPLNTQTALIVNVVIGWGFYLLAAIMGEQMIWLGMATILVSAGNFIAHNFLFNIKGKSIYNAGQLTSLLFFAPCVFFFFKIIIDQNLATTTDYLIGIPLGILINIFGIFKLVVWLKDKNTKYIFESRNLLPADREKLNKK